MYYLLKDEFMYTFLCTTSQTMSDVLPLKRWAFLYIVHSHDYKKSPLYALSAHVIFFEDDLSYMTHHSPSPILGKSGKWRKWLLSIYLGLFNPFPNKPWVLRVCSIGLLKTL